jgi:signal transduction histidine kinase/ActR/RegA family two-component response regulator
MIEREHHRADANMLQVGLSACLKGRQADLVDRAARAAFERGYARHVPDLPETLQSMVAGISEAIVAFSEAQEGPASCPAEHFDHDLLTGFLRQQVATLGSLGVRAEVHLGLLHQCREAYRACSFDSVPEKGHFFALLETCFERLELSLVAAWATEGRAGEPNSRAVPLAREETVRTSSQAAVDAEIARRVSARTQELVAANERLRRELELHIRAEEERKLHYDTLLRSQKLEAVGLLAGGVAYELSNLFQVVRCNLELLRSRADSTSCGMLEEVQQAAERSVTLVRQLLMFSRKQPMARHVLDVGEVVRDLLRLLRRVMPDNIRLFAEVEDNLPQVRADLSAIEQLIMNLVVNARDAMAMGGTIHVSVCCQQRVPPDRIRAVSSMQQIGIFVRDAGTGMAEDILNRIFDPFFTTKSRSPGLGLSVVHGIIEEHGGWIEVSSTSGQGSCFAVFLPVMQDVGPSTSSIEVIGDDRFRANGEHLLLVEDEEIVRRVLCRELTRYGYAIQAVGSAEEALAIYRRAPGHFDCVISDGLMPGISGPEMLLEMLKENAKQRAIFISSYAPTIGCWEALKSRGYRLIAKPFGTRELVTALRETLSDNDDVAAMTVRSPGMASGDD